VPAITTIAHELAELSSLSCELGDLIRDGKPLYKDELVENAGKTLSRLEFLTRYFEDAITHVKEGRAPRRFLNVFKESSLNDLKGSCRTIKEPLRMMISTLKIALEENRLKK